MSENLLPCPFCGSEAEIIHIEEGENAGGSCVCCIACQASGPLEFERKENFISNWNRRALLHPQVHSFLPAEDGEYNGNVVELQDADFNQHDPDTFYSDWEEATA